MPLLDLWKSNPDAVSRFTIEQVVSTAGDGHLADATVCSTELRKYFAVVQSSKLFEHVDRCLTQSFQKSGFVLQDLVNELGCRLDYNVESGLYQGRQNSVGYDGIWRAPEGRIIIVEVKTTDAYRINLDRVARYRSQLVAAGQLRAENSSILIVVGREDTGELEAQIRGSRHAWDTRIISIDALKKLVSLKEGAEEDSTVAKIRGILTPFEYTRLDNIIDVMFTAARDVERGPDEPPPGPMREEEEGGERRQPHTPRAVVAELRQRIIVAIGRKYGTELIAQKRALFADPERKVRVACTVSKPYDGGYYWYAHHPAWDEFLEGATEPLLALGCVDRTTAYVLPHAVLKTILPFLNTTSTDDGTRYWHLVVEPDATGQLSIVLPRKGERIPLRPYELQLAEPH